MRSRSRWLYASNTRRTNSTFSSDIAHAVSRSGVAQPSRSYRLVRTLIRQPGGFEGCPPVPIEAGLRDPSRVDPVGTDERRVLRTASGGSGGRRSIYDLRANGRDSEHAVPARIAYLHGGAHAQDLPI